MWLGKKSAGHLPLKQLLIKQDFKSISCQKHGVPPHFHLTSLCQKSPFFCVTWSKCWNLIVSRNKNEHSKIRLCSR